VTWKGIVGQRFTADEFDNYVDELSLASWVPSFIVVHNTQVPTFADWRGQRTIDGLVEYYRDTLKWSGGPHLFIDGDWIWVFTPLTVSGVHSPSWNSQSWGVEIVGDFDHEPFGDAQKDLVLRALTTLHARMGWTETKIKLHKDDPATTHDYCPGKNIRREELESHVQTVLDLAK
jgi:hypothetical protein